MTRNAHRRMPWRALAGGLAFAAATACGGDSSIAPSPTPAALYWSLTASHQAIVLAIGDSLQLGATPRNAEGAAIPNLPAPTFTSQDPGKVTVDANGMLRGVDATGGTIVVASLQSGGVTHIDSIMVAVTPTAVPVASFSIHPAPYDSAIVPMGGLVFFNPTIRDAGGNDLFGIPVRYAWSDSSRVLQFFGMLQVGAPGTVTFTGTTTAYGVTFTDTVTYRITYATSATVFVDSATSTLSAPGLKIAANGSVTWLNQSLASMSITFDNPANVEGGNIPDIPPGGAETRKFLAPGTYTYHGNLPVMSGHVIVY